MTVHKSLSEGYHSARIQQSLGTPRRTIQGGLGRRILVDALAVITVMLVVVGFIWWIGGMQFWR